MYIKHIRIYISLYILYHNSDCLSNFHFCQILNVHLNVHYMALAGCTLWIAAAARAVRASNAKAPDLSVWGSCFSWLTQPRFQFQPQPRLRCNPSERPSWGS